MVLDHRDDCVVVTVTAQVVRGERGTLRQHHGGTRQFQQRWPGWYMIAVPAAQAGVVGVIEDRGLARADRYAVGQPDQGASPYAFGHPAEAGGVTQPRGEGSLEDRAKEPWI